jgi:cell division protein FtsI (penicillin-binding protein 3)
MVRAKRIALVHAVLVAFAVAIVGRAAQVQLWQGAQWRARAERQHMAAANVPAPRGVILDASGIPVAESRERVRLSVAPREVRDPKKLATLLRRVGVDAHWLGRVRDRKRAWVQLPKTYLPADVQELLAMRGVYGTPVGERVYTQSAGMRRLVGHADPEGRGIDGIELALDSILRGEVGRVTFVRDVKGRRFESPDAGRAEARPGHTVTLTINSALQDITDRALGDAVSSMGADGGDILVLDPHSGEILAMSSRRRDPRSTAATVFIEPYQPGSTLKPFIAATLIARGKANPHEVIETYNGTYRTFGRTINDVHREPRLSLADVIRHSSNVGIVRFAERLTPREQYEALRDFGFGTPTGVPYPLESPGRLYPPSQWSKQSAASLAMGYEISVTPLQLALAFASIANGGELLEPSLVKEVRDREGDVIFTNRRRVVRRVLTPGHAAEISRMLVAVVDSGTATDARLPTFSTGGKSGTVRGMAGGRYVAGSYTASYVGMFPADDPQYVILVKIDNPDGTYYGGKTAAPVSKVVLEAAIAARDASLDRSVLARRKVEPVFAARDTGPKRADHREQPPAEVVVARAEELNAGIASDPSSTEGVPFVVSLAERPRRLPEPVRVRPVPDVRGLPLREAVRRLHGSGFRVELATGEEGVTVPVAGTRVRTGSMVRLLHRR